MKRVSFAVALTLLLLSPSLRVAAEDGLPSALADYWQNLALQPIPGLPSAAHLDFVPVFPADSALWRPGSLILVTEGHRIVPLNKIIDRRGGGFKVFGDEREDVVALQSLVLGSGKPLDVSSLPLVLRSLGFVPRQGDGGQAIADLLAAADVRHIVVRFPDAQVHRIQRPRGAANLLSEDERQSFVPLLKTGEMQVVTSAVSVRSVELFFDKPIQDELRRRLELVLALDLKQAGESSLHLAGARRYVAIRTATLSRDGAFLECPDPCPGDGTDQLRRLVATDR